MLVKGKVTQEHINKGKPSEAFNCPVHHSLKEIFPNAFIGVVGEAMNFKEAKDSKDKSRRIRFPNYMGNRISYYDGTGNMEPFDYEFEI